MTTLLLHAALSLLIGEATYHWLRSRQGRGLSPYDRPGFPGPALWGLLLWLATPLGMAILLWRWGRWRWIPLGILAWLALAWPGAAAGA